jgi:hypothetical protein
MRESKRQAVKRDDRLYYLGVLYSETCQCEREKREGNAFCFKCYIRLPRYLRTALYQPIGNGFEQAYDDSCRQLNG